MWDAFFVTVGVKLNVILRYSRFIFGNSEIACVNLKLVWLKNLIAEVS